MRCNKVIYSTLYEILAAIKFFAKKYVLSLLLKMNMFKKKCELIEKKRVNDVSNLTCVILD